MSLTIQKEYLHTQITALQFLNEEYLLAGCGPFLRCYQLSSSSSLVPGHHQSKLVWNQAIFTQGSRIHGLKLQEYSSSNGNPRKIKKWKLIAFGGKSLKWMDVILSDTTDLQITNQSIEPEHHKDWIKDALWIEVLIIP